MFYLRFFDALNRHGIRYLVVGGMAVNLHGVVRLTLDVDIAVDSSIDQSQAWEKICKELKLTPRQPVTWKQMYSAQERKRLRDEKNLIAFGLLPDQPEDPVIDIIFEPQFNFQEALKRKIVQNVKEVEIPLASIQDLIDMKIVAGRTKDLQDIEHLKKIKK